MADEPTQEEIEAAFGKIRMGDLLLQTVYTVSQLVYQRMTAEPPELGQARLGIDALAALIPVLDVPPEAHRDLDQMVSNLKLAYAAAVSEPVPTPEPAPAPEPEKEPEPEEPDAGS